ncbi:MAG: hypothetical protein MUF00_20290 [Gemmatimonadaceae bacterium]|jgi:hypothetical protein|nr:hypothetical protein [Gemmatimonadaceae bacterium]
MADRSEQDLPHSLTARYRFTETPGREYGPRTLHWIYRNYADRQTCEVLIDSQGVSVSGWISVAEMIRRLIMPLAQQTQRTRLTKLGVHFDAATLTRDDARCLIHEAELNQPPSDQERAEAEALGVTTAELTTRRALQAAVAEQEAEDADGDAEEDDPSDLHWVGLLRRRGAKLPAQISEDEFKLWQDSWDRWEAIAEEVRYFGIRMTRPKRWTREELDALSAQGEAFKEFADEHNEDHVSHFLGRDAAIPRPVMRTAYQAVWQQIQDGTWAGRESEIAAVYGGVERDLLARSSQRRARTTSRAPSASPAPPIRAGSSVLGKLIIQGLSLSGRLLGALLKLAVGTKRRRR